MQTKIVTINCEFSLSCPVYINLGLQQRPASAAGLSCCDSITWVMCDNTKCNLAFSPCQAFHCCMLMICVINYICILMNVYNVMVHY